MHACERWRAHGASRFFALPIHSRIYTANLARRPNKSFRALRHSLDIKDEIARRFVFWCPKRRFGGGAGGTYVCGNTATAENKFDTDWSGENAESTSWIVALVRSVNCMQLRCGVIFKFIDKLNFTKVISAGAAPTRGIQIVSTQGIIEVYETSHYRIAYEPFPSLAKPITGRFFKRKQMWPASFFRGCAKRPEPFN